MVAAPLTEADLRGELDEFKGRFPQLAEDEQALVLACVHCRGCRLGGLRAPWRPHDKGVDAVLIDDAARIVFFKRRGLDREFDQWCDCRNPARGKFNAAWGRFQKALDEELV